MADASILKDLEILPMTLDDMEDVLKIEKLSFPTPWPRSQFEKELKNQFSNQFTAKITQDGRETVVAYIIFWIVADESHILNIAVHPDFRKKGIAKTLLAFTLKQIEEAGAREVFLEARRSNIPAQKMYAGFGFREIGIRKGYYGDNKEDAIVMTLFLKDTPQGGFKEKEQVGKGFV